MSQSELISRKSPVLPESERRDFEPGKQSFAEIPASTLSQASEGNYPSPDQKSLGDSGVGRRAASRCFVMHLQDASWARPRAEHADS